MINILFICSTFYLYVQPMHSNVLSTMHVQADNDGVDDSASAVSPKKSKAAPKGVTITDTSLLLAFLTFIMLIAYRVLYYI